MLYQPEKPAVRLVKMMDSGRKNRKPITVLMTVLLIMVLCAGCGATKSPADTLNNKVLLHTKDVVALLGENGVALTKAIDFPVDLSSCKVKGATPQAYFDGKTGSYYLFYEYGGYSETSELVQKSRLYNYPGVFDDLGLAKSFSDALLPGTAGKNLFVCLWYPEAASRQKGMTGIEGKTYERILSERAKTVEIIDEKAFNQKSVVLTGTGETWEVRMPVEYILNRQETKDDLTKTVFYSNGETELQYRKGSAPPDVTSLKWSMGNGTESTQNIDGGSLLTKKEADGFYRASSSEPSGFDPEEQKSILVTVTWGNGHTEEIICKFIPQVKCAGICRLKQ